MKKLFFFLPFLILTTVSCTKEPPYEAQGYIDITFQGRLIDVYSQEPIVNGTAQLHHNSRANGGGYPGFVYRAVQTDESGYFRFDIRADLDSSYSVSCVAEDYYGNYGVSYNSDRLFNGNVPTSHAVGLKYHNPWKERFSATISLVPTATLRIHLVNVNGVYDRFGMNTPPGSPLGNNIWTSGMNVDEYYEFKVYGGTEINLDTFKFLPGANSTQYEYLQIHITCTPHDVTELLIEY